MPNRLVTNLYKIEKKTKTETFLCTVLGLFTSLGLHHQMVFIRFTVVVYVSKYEKFEEMNAYTFHLNKFREFSISHEATERSV